MAGETTEPTPVEEPEVEDVQEIDELEDGSTDEEDSDDPEGEPEETEEETVEFERDGVKIRIPAALKDEFMLKADYTRKTQEVAEQRKALETRITEVQQASEAEVTARARSVAIDAALQQYQNVDWDTLEAQDPVSAQRHFRTYMQLQQQKGEADQDYSAAKEARELEAQRVAAERVEQGIAELQRDIPDWGPSKAEALMSFGEKQFGFSREYMESVDDPKLVKLLNAAYLALSPGTKPKQSATSQIRPAAKVKGSSSPPPKGLDDRLSPEEWMRRRNEQLARQR